MAIVSTDSITDPTLILTAGLEVRLAWPQEEQGPHSEAGTHLLEFPRTPRPQPQARNSVIVGTSTSLMGGISPVGASIGLMGGVGP